MVCRAIIAVLVLAALVSAFMWWCACVLARRADEAITDKERNDA